jgi:CubicO group peptidase (beta-lactamase class C family)
MLRALGCVAAVFAASGAPTAAASPTPLDPGGIDRFLAAGLDRIGVPGMAVTVTHGADVVHVAGYGTDGRGHSVTPHTRFRIGSLSKSFTAAAVLQLAESGRVDLDAPGAVRVVSTTTPTRITKCAPGSSKSSRVRRGRIGSRSGCSPRSG